MMQSGGRLEPVSFAWSMVEVVGDLVAGAATAAAPPGGGIVVRLLGPVVGIVGGHVPAQFPSDGARMAL